MRKTRWWGSQTFAVAAVQWRAQIWQDPWICWAHSELHLRRLWRHQPAPPTNRRNEFRYKNGNTQTHLDALSKSSINSKDVLMLQYCASMLNNTNLGRSDNRQNIFSTERQIFGRVAFETIHCQHFCTLNPCVLKIKKKQRIWEMLETQTAIRWAYLAKYR